MNRLAAHLRYLWSHSGYLPLTSEWRLIRWRIRTMFSGQVVIDFPKAGFRFSIPAEWRGIAKMAYVFRDECEPELARLDPVVQAGSVAIDIGAHYGNYSLALSHLVGDSGHVIAVEPMARAMAVLRTNVALNDAQNVTTIQSALGSEKRKAFLHHHADPSRASLGEFAVSRGGEEVVVTTLDDLVLQSGLQAVDFIKLDVEGAEVEVLEGARHTIDRCRPTVMFERLETTADRLGHGTNDAWRFLEERGYRFVGINDRGSFVEIDANTPSGPNVLALPTREAVHRMLGTLQ